MVRLPVMLYLTSNLKVIAALDEAKFIVNIALGFLRSQVEN